MAIIKYKTNKANRYWRLLTLPTAALQCPLVLLILSVSCLLWNFYNWRQRILPTIRPWTELEFQPNPDLDASCNWMSGCRMRTMGSIYSLSWVSEKSIWKDFYWKNMHCSVIPPFQKTLLSAAALHRCPCREVCQ